MKETYLENQNISNNIVFDKSNNVYKENQQNIEKDNNESDNSYDSDKNETIDNRINDSYFSDIKKEIQLQEVEKDNLQENDEEKNNIHIYNKKNNLNNTRDKNKTLNNLKETNILTDIDNNIRTLPMKTNTILSINKKISEKFGNKKTVSGDKINGKQLESRFRIFTEKKNNFPNRISVSNENIRMKNSLAKREINFKHSSSNNHIIKRPIIIAKVTKLNKEPENENYLENNNILKKKFDNYKNNNYHSLNNIFSNQNINMNLSPQRENYISGVKTIEKNKLFNQEDKFFNYKNNSNYNTNSNNNFSKLNLKNNKNDDNQINLERNNFFKIKEKSKTININKDSEFDSLLNEGIEEGEYYSNNNINPMEKNNSQNFRKISLNQQRLTNIPSKIENNYSINNNTNLSQRLTVSYDPISDRLKNFVENIQIQKQINQGQSQQINANQNLKQIEPRTNSPIGAIVRKLHPPNNNIIKMNNINTINRNNIYQVDRQSVSPKNKNLEERINTVINNQSYNNIINENNLNNIKKVNEVKNLNVNYDNINNMNNVININNINQMNNLDNINNANFSNNMNNLNDINFINNIDNIQLNNISNINNVNNIKNLNNMNYFNNINNIGNMNNFNNIINTNNMNNINIHTNSNANLLNNRGIAFQNNNLPIDFPIQINEIQNKPVTNNVFPQITNQNSIINNNYINQIINPNQNSQINITLNNYLTQGQNQVINPILNQNKLSNNILTSTISNYPSFQLNQRMTQIPTNFQSNTNQMLNQNKILYGPLKNELNNINSSVEKNGINKEETKKEINVTYNSFGQSGWLKNYGVLTLPGKDASGSQKTNQDSFVFKTCINKIKDFNIFGVLDGHGPEGHFVSKFASEFIPSKLINHPEIQSLRDPELIYRKLKENNCKIITEMFRETDNQLKNVDFDTIESGSTCVLVIHIGPHIICANTGDSRALVVFDSIGENNLNHYTGVPLSIDYKPELPEETNRILMNGGEVRQLKDESGEGVGPFRVFVRNENHPGLAMSRSIGDLKGKRIGVIPDPGILEYDLCDKTKYIVVCSDGVWEFLSNESVRDIGKKYYVQNDPNSFCHNLINQSLNLWETNDIVVDDITAVVAFF